MITCTNCGQKISIYWMCDEEGDGFYYCQTCFNTHPCYLGNHGEECATLVMDDIANKGKNSHGQDN